jgi:hypothetical protein
MNKAIAAAHGWGASLALIPRGAQGYGAIKGAATILSFLLSRRSRSARFVWSPALDLSDHTVFSTLIPGAQY